MRALCSAAGPYTPFPFNFHMVLNEHTVMKHCDIRRFFYRAIGIESGSGVNNIVRLPFARFAGRVDQRDGLLIDRTGLSVGIGRIIVAVENLDFINGLCK